VSKLIATEFVSLDGVMEDPGGSEEFEHGGWSFKVERGEEGNQFKLDETMQSDALLLGRITYQGFAEAWPSRTGEFADKFNTMPKFVVSATLEDPEWNNTTVIKGNVAEEVSKLKQQPGGDIVIHGSAQLVQALLEDDLIDEYRLMVFPIVLGSGKRLFSDTGKAMTLKLVDSKTVGAGVLILTYQPA
jgi:dihydrofolate reductase